MEITFIIFLIVPVVFFLIMLVIFIIDRHKTKHKKEPVEYEEPTDDK